ncbi:hypothetical protein [Ornithinimicrobium murale]|uniref:hypothetical protein n=1 Tax=Ornithinimicrobium murale TaxID=1050153 RepID=UPI000E0D3D6B|nr:hypothetical protein [Ornithinimicrobium murale]
MAHKHEDTPEEQELNNRVDREAMEVALEWRDAGLPEAVARHRLLILILQTSILDSCSHQQALRPTSPSREDMRDWMFDLLQRKCLINEKGSQSLDLTRIADGNSLSGWARVMLTRAGDFGRKRLVRTRANDVRRVARAADGTEMGLTHPDSIQSEDASAKLIWAPTTTSTEDDAIAALEEKSSALDLPAAIEVRENAVTDFPDLLESGNRNVALAVAFDANRSRYRGATRLHTQVALFTRLMEVTPPPRMPLSRREDRALIRAWCLDNPGGGRLMFLLSELLAGREPGDVTEVEQLLVSLFEGYSMSEAAALMSSQGYVLVHLAQSAVEPVPPPQRKIVRKMTTRVTEMVGAPRASRLVRQWAAAHGELTVSEYAGRGAEPVMKSAEQAQADEDLFNAEVSKLFTDRVAVLGQSLTAVRTYLDQLHEQLMLDELGAQVDEWIASPGTETGDLQEAR